MPPSATASKRFWHIALIFPNLSLGTFDGFITDDIAICSVARIPGVIEAHAANQTNQELSKRFQTVFGEKYEPSVLAVATGDDRLLTAETLRDFRNVCAICAVAGGRSAKLGDGMQWAIHYSDFFQFNHHIAGKDGAILTLDGISRGMDDEIEKYLASAAASIRNPANFSTEIDKPLLATLSKQWRRRHFRRRTTRNDRQTFRALEIAFQASRYPSDGFVTNNDIGTRIGLWVSAFETLFHPGKRNVDKRDVQAALRSANWTDKEFTQSKYSISYRGNRLRVTLAEKLYDQLYAVRNDFMHGERPGILSKRWRFRGKDAPLEFVVPSLFAAALRAKLVHKPDEPYDELADEHFWGIGRIQRALKLTKGIRRRRF
jgi:hypothetical protein